MYSTRLVKRFLIDFQNVLSDFFEAIGNEQKGFFGATFFQTL
jgi:hypothetical protein